MQFQLIYTSIAILLILLFFSQTAVLNFLTKSLGAKKNYKTSLKMNGVFWFLYILAAVFDYYILKTSFGGFYFSLLMFLVFCFLLKKFFEIPLKKTVLINLLYSLSTVAISVVLILFSKGLLYTPLYMTNDLMEPTVKKGEYMIFKKIANTYNKGDVIAFYSSESKKASVRKIIGLPGEKIELRDKTLFVGEEIVKESINGEDFIIELKEDEYFVIAEKQSDEDENAVNYGVVNKKMIIGKYWFSIPI